MRALKIVFGIVAAVVAIAAMLLFVGFPAGFMTSAIQSRVERETGYRLTIDGTSRIALLPSPSVTLSDVTLQDGADPDSRTRIGVSRIQADMALAGLWSAHPEITRLVVTRPVVSIPLLRERRASSASAAKEVPSGIDDASSISIDRVTVTDGSTVLFNRHDHVESHIESISADAVIGADYTVMINGDAQAGGHPLKFGVKASLPGAPLQRQNIPVDLKFEAPDLLSGPLTGRALVRLNGSVIAINGVTGKLGDGAFNGWASVDLASKPQVELDLDFQRLGIATLTDNARTPSQPWSDTPVDLIGLNYVDLQGRVSIGQLSLGSMQIEPFSTQATLNNGTLKSRFEKLGTYGGEANGDLVVDASGSAPSYTLHSDLVGVRALPLLQNLAGFDRLDGKLQATLALRASGTSQRAIMTNLDGTASVLFQDGAIRGINVAQMIRSLTTNPLSGWQEDNTQATDLAQLSASFQIANGQATTNDLNLVGPLVRVTGGGTIDVGRQTLALRVDPKLVPTTEGQGRSSDPVGLGIPVAIDGPWSEPRIYPDIAGMMDDPDAAYAKLKQMGKGLFGANGALNGLLGGNGASGGSDNGSDNRNDGSLGGDLGQTLGNIIQQGLKQWRNSPPAR
jgi:AsmA protein